MGRPVERANTVATSVLISETVDVELRAYCLAYRIGVGPVIDRALVELLELGAPPAPPPGPSCRRPVSIDAEVHAQVTEWRKSAAVGFSAAVELALVGFLQRRAGGHQAQRDAPYDWTS